MNLWTLLKGKKTYLVSLGCIASLLWKSLCDHAQGLPVDMTQLMHQVLMCLATMALRHGVASTESAQGNGGQP